MQPKTIASDKAKPPYHLTHEKKKHTKYINTYLPPKALIAKYKITHRLLRVGREH